MSLTLFINLYLVVSNANNFVALNLFNLVEFMKVIQIRDPVSIIKKLESHKVYQPFIAEST